MDPHPVDREYDNHPIDAAYRRTARTSRLWGEPGSRFVGAGGALVVFAVLLFIVTPFLLFISNPARVFLGGFIADFDGGRARALQWLAWILTSFGLAFCAAMVTYTEFGKREVDPDWEEETRDSPSTIRWRSRTGVAALLFLVAALVPVNVAPERPAAVRAAPPGVAAPTTIMTPPTTTVAPNLSATAPPAIPPPTQSPQEILAQQARASSANAKRAKSAAAVTQQLSEKAQRNFQNMVATIGRVRAERVVAQAKAIAAAARREANVAIAQANAARARVKAEPLATIPPPPDQDCLVGQTWNGFKCKDNDSGDWGDY